MEGPIPAQTLIPPWTARCQGGSASTAGQTSGGRHGRRGPRRVHGVQGRTSMRKASTATQTRACPQGLGCAGGTAPCPLMDPSVPSALPPPPGSFSGITVGALSARSPAPSATAPRCALLTLRRVTLCTAQRQEPRPRGEGTLLRPCPRRPACEPPRTESDQLPPREGPCGTS